MKFSCGFAASTWRACWQALAFALAAAVPAQAQEYPTKAIQFVVPYPPGGASDVVARTIALQLSESLQAARGDREPARGQRHHRADPCGEVAAPTAIRC